MTSFVNQIQWILSFVLILSSIGVVLLRKPVHASLSFLLTLLTLSVLYLVFSAQFISVIQILVYAGAILVIFMFVIVLFQDAHQQIDRFKPNCMPFFLFIAANAFLLTLLILGSRFTGIWSAKKQLPEGYGTVQSLGEKLYIDFFFPFEAVVLLFLVALIGAVYIGRKEE
jgi:NADH-quinone oxidoreductase subunit J